jgi:hypothetical protein
VNQFVILQGTGVHIYGGVGAFITVEYTVGLLAHIVP